MSQSTRSSELPPAIAGLLSLFCLQDPLRRRASDAGLRHDLTLGQLVTKVRKWPTGLSAGTSLQEGQRLADDLLRFAYDLPLRETVTPLTTVVNDEQALRRLGRRGFVSVEDVLAVPDERAVYNIGSRTFGVIKNDFSANKTTVRYILEANRRPCPVWLRPALGAERLALAPAEQPDRWRNVGDVNPHSSEIPANREVIEAHAVAAQAVDHLIRAIAAVDPGLAAMKSQEAEQLLGFSLQRETDFGP